MSGKRKKNKNPEIAKIINEKKKIGSINNITLSDGTKFVQLGVTQ